MLCQHTHLKGWKRLRFRHYEQIGPDPAVCKPCSGVPEPCRPQGLLSKALNILSCKKNITLEKISVKRISVISLVGICVYMFTTLYWALSAPFCLAFLSIFNFPSQCKPAPVHLLSSQEPKASARPKWAQSSSSTCSLKLSSFFSTLIPVCDCKLDLSLSSQGST